MSHALDLTLILPRCGGRQSNPPTTLEFDETVRDAPLGRDRAISPVANSGHCHQSTSGPNPIRCRVLKGRLHDAAPLIRFPDRSKIVSDFDRV